MRPPKIILIDDPDWLKKYEDTLHSHAYEESIHLTMNKPDLIKPHQEL